MVAGYSLRKLGEMVNYHLYADVIVIGGAYFQMVILDQLIEIPTLDIFQVKPNVTRPVTYLLAREALTHVLTNAAANTWPGVAFLDSRNHLCNALVAHGIMSTKQNFMLVQLWHYNHARTFVQWTLLRWILKTKNSIFVYKQKIFFLLVIVTCERTHVFRKNVMINRLLCYLLLYG